MVMVTPPMTETIASANAAASTLFLGHNGEWWDSALILFAVIAGLAATAVGITTAGSIISHKREAAAAEVALEKYKLDTGKQISEANAAGDAAKTVAAKANEAVALANERAAALEKEAEQARLEQERLKSLVQWRTITDPQGDAMVAVLKPLISKKIILATMANDPEATTFGIVFANVFHAAGWSIRHETRTYGATVFLGIVISNESNPTAAAVRAAFTKAKIPFATKEIPMPGSILVQDEDTRNPEVTIMIGSRIPVGTQMK